MRIAIAERVFVLMIGFAATVRLLTKQVSARLSTLRRMPNA